MSTKKPPKVAGQIGRARPRLLTREQFVASATGRPAGFRDIADLLADLRAGQVALSAGGQRVVSVLEHLFNGEAKPADLDAALGLRAGRGRRPSTLFAVMRGCLEGKNGRIVRFIRDAEANEEPRISKAIVEASVRFGMHERNVQKLWGRAQPYLRIEEMLQEFDRQAELGVALIRQHVSEEELKGQMGTLPWREVVEIARARASKDGGAQIVPFPRR